MRLGGNSRTGCFNVLRTTSDHGCIPSYYPRFFLRVSALVSLSLSSSSSLLSLSLSFARPPFFQSRFLRQSRRIHGMRPESTLKFQLDARFRHASSAGWTGGVKNRDEKKKGRRKKFEEGLRVVCAQSKYVKCIWNGVTMQSSRMYDDHNSIGIQPSSSSGNEKILASFQFFWTLFIWIVCLKLSRDQKYKRERKESLFLD